MAAPDAPMDFGGGWSAPATSRRAFELIEDLDWKSARVLDVGTGTGMFARALCGYCKSIGLEPREHVAACDMDPSSFDCEEIECDQAAADGRLPYDDGTFDAVLSIEVIEHVEDQFAFLRELVRVTKPGGRVIVTTPNTLNVNSRLRTLTWGFPLLFDPLPLANGDPRRLGGHIHPISPYFLAFNALRAGLEGIELHSDRTKKSAAFLTVLCSPLLFVGGGLQAARLKRKHPDVASSNRGILGAMSGWRLLTGRTTVLRARKPAGGG